MVNRIFCLDVDGTIVAREGEFYPKAKWMCNQLSKLSWRIALCSARPMKSLVSIANEIKNIELISCLGGAIISKKIEHSKTNQNSAWEICHHSEFITYESLTHIIEWAISNGISDIWAFDSTEWYVTAKTERVEREAFITGLAPQFCSTADFPAEGLLKFVFPHIPVEGMQSLQRCVELQGLIANYSTDTQVEVNTPLTSDKGVEVIRSLIAPSQKTFVASLGDGANDFGMLSASDFPLTFSDGHASLIKIAKRVLNQDRTAAYSDIVHLFSTQQEGL